MKNVYEVLRQKELDVSRLEIEVKALRVVAPLLSEGHDAGDDLRLAATRSTTLPPSVKALKATNSFP